MKKIVVVLVMLLGVTMASAQIKISAEATCIERYAAVTLTAVRCGKYYYRVTSIDRSNNESAPSKAVMRSY